MIGKMVISKNIWLRRWWIEGIVRLVKCKIGELPDQRNVRLGNCLVGEMFVLELAIGELASWAIVNRETFQKKPYGVFRFLFYKQPGSGLSPQSCS